MCLGAYAKSEYEKNQSWVFLYPGRLTSAAGRQARVVARIRLSHEFAPAGDRGLSMSANGEALRVYGDSHLKTPWPRVENGMFMWDGV